VIGPLITEIERMPVVDFNNFSFSENEEEFRGTVTSTISRLSIDVPEKKVHWLDTDSSNDE
jgi:hypothetical protein